MLAITYLPTQATRPPYTAQSALPYNPHLAAYIATECAGMTPTVEVYPSYPVLEIPMLVPDFAPEPTADMPDADTDPL